MGVGKVELLRQVEVALNVIPAPIRHSQDQLQGGLVNEAGVDHLSQGEGSPLSNPCNATNIHLSLLHLSNESDWMENDECLGDVTFFFFTECELWQKF